MRFRFTVSATLLAIAIAISGIAVATSSPPPVFIDELGRLEIPAKEAAVEGQTAYVIAGGCTSEGTPPVVSCEGTLSVVDTRNPAMPELVGQMTTDTEAFETLAVATSGEYVYLVVRELHTYWEIPPRRLAVMDVSDPAAIAEVTSLELPTDYLRNIGVEVAGNLLVVSSTRTNVTLFDISEPASPVEITSLDTVADDIAVNGTKLYVAKESDDSRNEIPDGLAIYDISDPAAPVKLGQVRGDYRGVAAYGEQAFVVGQSLCYNVDAGYYRCGTVLLEYDVSDPSNPILHEIERHGQGGIHTLLGGPHTWIGEVVKKGNALLVVAGRLHVLDLSLPNRDKVGEYFPEFPPDELGDTVGSVVHTALTNGKVLVAVRHDDSQGIRTLDVSTTTAQVFLPFITR